MTSKRTSRTLGPYANVNNSAARPKNTQAAPMLSNARATTPRPAIKPTKIYHIISYRPPVCDLGATERSSMFLTDMACERAVDMPRVERRRYGVNRCSNIAGRMTRAVQPGRQDLIYREGAQGCLIDSAGR